MSKLTGNVVNTLFIACAIGSTSVCAEGADTPCSGTDAFLNIVGRPSNMVSACTIPAKKMDIESGYQYQQLSSGEGTQQNFPQLEFRFGFPAGNEFFVFPSNRISQSKPPISGYTQTTMGFKHQFADTGNWLTAFFGSVNLSDGSAAFGNRQLGFNINGMANYNLTSKLTLQIMLGGSTLSTSALSGGQRYNSINPDLLLSYAISATINVYAEVYGQSSTGPGLGAGFNSDAGVLFLVRPNMVIDVSAGQRISGFPGGFENYIGAGLSVLLS